MIQHSFIDEKHFPTLQSISKNHQVGGDAVLIAIYKATMELLDNANATTLIYMQSRIVDGKMVIATSTHPKLGVYVQLARTEGEKGNGLITVGQKYALERKNSTTSTIETMMF